MQFLTSEQYGADYDELSSIPPFSKLEKLRIFINDTKGKPQTGHLFEANTRIRSIEVFCRNDQVWYKFQRQTIPGVTEFICEEPIPDEEDVDPAFTNEWSRYSDENYETQIDGFSRSG